jgi:predicted Zn-dependent protease
MNRKWAAVVMMAFGSACATNPATGRRQLSLIGEEQEVQMGREADGEIVAATGLYEDADLQVYVQGVGLPLAKGSERAGLPWTFRVVDDAAVNAFALPGGYIYATRGILAYMGSEAELAAVLGHETGHVTARHSVNQISRAQLATLGLGVGMILKPELVDYADLAQVGLGLLFLKYGRGAEREADDLGFRYITRNGYDPRPMTAVFDTLSRVSAASGEGRLPAWLSTHPDPEDRGRRISELIQSLPPAQRQGRVEREAYLRRIDGIVFGDDPREGFFEGSTFYHPEMRFRLQFPRGWKTSNQKAAVSALSPGRDAVVVVTLTRRDTPEAAAREFFAQQGVRQGGSWRGSLDSLPAVAHEFAAATTQGELQGLAAFVAHRGHVFQLLGYAPQSRWGAHRPIVSSSLGSFGLLDDRRYLDVQPSRVRLVALPQPMTLREFAQRYPSTVPLATLAIINQVGESDRLEPGRLVKRVVGGTTPAQARSGIPLATTPTREAVSIPRRSP